MSCPQVLRFGPHSPLHSAMAGPPASAAVTVANKQGSKTRNRRKMEAAEILAHQVAQAAQHPPQDWWEATCSICKGQYDSLTHCACYAVQEVPGPVRGPLLYVSPQSARSKTAQHSPPSKETDQSEQRPNPGNQGYQPFRHSQSYPPVGERPWQEAPPGRRQRLAG